MKKVILLFPLLLTACASQPMTISTKLIVVTPPNSMYNCPIVTQFPDYKTLDDIKVARLIIKLYRNNKECKYSLNSIKKYLNKESDIINNSK